MTFAVILAGGWGERLWPMSTRGRPKQLLTLTGDTSLVRSTLLRISPLVAVRRTLVVTNVSLRELIASELPEVPRERVIGEPVGKNTAPAIALAAHLVLAEDPEAVMVVLPADHIIRDDRAFRAAIATAISTAERLGALVTLGIRPSRDETEYGYIEAGDPSAAEGALPVRRFTEKPDKETARRFVGAGGYYWNSGMFVWRADTLLSEIERHLPEIASALSDVPSDPGDRRFNASLIRFYEACPSISIDYGVMEEASGVHVVPVECGWDDVGGWGAVARVWPADGSRNTIRGDAVTVDTSDCVIYSEGGRVAVVGMSGIVVARTPNGTLVCPRDRARDVRGVVEQLRHTRKLSEEQGE